MQAGSDNSQLSPLSAQSAPAFPQPQQLPLTFYTTQSEDEDEELDLREILKVIRRRARLIGGVTVVVAGAVGLWTFLTPRIYRGEFQMLVESPDQGGKATQQILSQSIFRNNSDVSASGIDYTTQIEVLRSPKLLNPIVERLQRFNPDLNYGAFSGDLEVERLNQATILEVGYEHEDPEFIAAAIEALAKDYLNYSTEQQQASIQQGVQFIDEKLPELRQRVDTGQQALEEFRQRYSLLDPDARGGELSTLIHSIKQQQEETQIELGQAASLYGLLQKQLGYQSADALAAVSLSESERYQELLNQIQEVETELAVELTRFTEESPTIQTLREKQQNLLTLLNQEAAQVAGRNNLSGDFSSETAGNLNSIAIDLSTQLVNTENRIEVLQVRTRALTEAEARLRQEFARVPSLARQYTDLQRELTVATESLNRFLENRERLQLEAIGRITPWELLIAPTVLKKPVFPNVPLNLSLGVVAGLVLGLGAALLAEKLDNVFHSAEQLKASIQLPLLGVIPYKQELTAETTPDQLSQETQQSVPLNGHRVSHSVKRLLGTQPAEASNKFYTQSIFREAFRSLHTNIRFLSSDQSIRSIVISSAVPTDGKSTVSFHLAKTAAAMGQCVLLVDADLRRPQVHSRLNLPNMQGLSNAIATGLDPHQVIQPCSQEENFFVLTAGQIPPDPTKLLSSDKMKQLINQFEKDFDLVIYDTPPLLGLADARLIAANTDGLAIVVGLGRTDVSAVMQALDSVRTSNISILGIIANGVKRDAASDYGYGYTSRYFTQAEEHPAEDTEVIS